MTEHARQSRAFLRGLVVLLAVVLLSAAASLWAMEIVNDVPLRFGTFVGPAGGTVDVLPDGTRNVVGVYGVAGIFSPASFTVTSDRGNPHYSITLPVSVALTAPNGATMRVDNFRSIPAGTGAARPPAHTDQLTVGATLHIDPAQRPGEYTGYFPVTVNLGF